MKNGSKKKQEGREIDILINYFKKEKEQKKMMKLIIMKKKFISKSKMK